MSNTDADEVFGKQVTENNITKEKLTAKKKEADAKMYVWTEAYLVHLHRFPANKARILADDAIDIYMQKYNEEI